MSLKIYGETECKADCSEHLSGRFTETLSCAPDTFGGKGLYLTVLGQDFWISNGVDLARIVLQACGKLELLKEDSA